MDILKIGSKGQAVQDWQSILVVLGFTDKDNQVLKPDGDFGSKTFRATMKLQLASSLPATGEVDERTRAAAEALLRPSEPTIPGGSTAPPPPPKFIRAKNYTGANRTKIDLIVIHTMEAPEKGETAEQIATWFGSEQAPKASAHYCCDSNSVIQCVRDEDVAWHAPGANNNGIGIEHAGYAKQTAAEWADVFSKSMLAISAKLSAKLCKKWGIPPVKLSVDELVAKQRGFCGHIDITNAFNGGKGHWDPGKDFPWAEYMSMVATELAKLG